LNILDFDEPVDWIGVHYHLVCLAVQFMGHCLWPHGAILNNATRGILFRLESIIIICCYWI